jgi:hypothetical protein
MHQLLRCLRTTHASNSGGQNFRFKVASNASRRVLHEKVSVVFASIVQFFKLVIKLPFLFYLVHVVLVIICFILNNLCI